MIVRLFFTLVLWIVQRLLNMFLLFYDHIDIAVASLIVDLLVVLVITQHHQVGFRRNLQEIHPISLPDLSKPSRTSEHQHFRDQNL